MLTVFNQYPHSNIDSVGDLLNYRGYTFAGANPEKLNTYIARLDYKITENGNHSLFVRGNLQNDNQQEAPEFPGQPSSDFHTSNNKGIAAGYTALLRPTLINNLRWSLVREGAGRFRHQLATLRSFPHAERHYRSGFAIGIRQRASA